MEDQKNTIDNRVAVPFIVAGVLSLIIPLCNAIVTICNQFGYVFDNIVSNGDYKYTITYYGVFIPILFSILIQPISYILIATGYLSKGKLIKLSCVGYVLNAGLVFLVTIFQVAGACGDYKYMRAPKGIIILILFLVFDTLARLGIAVGMVLMAACLYKRLELTMLNTITFIIICVAEGTSIFIHLVVLIFHDQHYISPASECALSGILFMIIAFVILMFLSKRSKVNQAA